MSPVHRSARGIGAAGAAASLLAVAWPSVAAAAADGVPSEPGGTLETLLIGGLLFIGLYNALLFFPTRAPAYACYAGYAGSLGVVWATYFDETAGLVSTEGLRVAVNHGATGLSLFFGQLFALTFLDLATRCPGFASVLRWTSALTALLLPVSLFLGPALGEALLGVFGFAVPALVLSAGVASLRAGFGPARFYLLGWTPLLVAVVVFALGHFELTPRLLDGTELLMVNAFEAMALALALADRIRHLTAERDRALRDGMAQLRLREETTARARALEQERTDALAQAARERARALTDALTGFGNRLAFQTRVAELDAAGTRPVLVGILDVDGLKRVNDARGHAEGDRLLTSLADGLRSRLRGTDECFRLGGDEFALLVPGSLAEDAIRFRIGEAVDEVRGLGFPEVDASVGFDRLEDPGGTLEEAVARADARMYEEKRAARASGRPRESQSG